jgi:hypothetical protein
MAELVVCRLIRIWLTEPEFPQKGDNIRPNDLQVNTPKHRTSSSPQHFLIPIYTMAAETTEA